MSPFLAWGDFHAHSRFARSTIPEDKWGTTRNLAKTQIMSLGKSQFTYHLSVEDQIIGIEYNVKILGVTLDKDLSYKPHVDMMLKKLMLKLRYCVK